MLISTGRVPASEPWNILEVAMNQSADIVAVRLEKQLKRLREPVEALVPMRRTAEGLAEWIVEHVYVHGANGSLRTIANTPGIDCIRKELADADWIAQLMREEQRAQIQRLHVGDFVRVLMGPCARLCGTVSRLKEQRAIVKVKMFTKTISVHSHVKNLQAVRCPKEQQLFYYSPSLFA